MSKKKKIIILSSMIALLAITAVLNFVLSGNVTKSEANGNLDATVSVFAEYRNERSTTRNEELLQLDSIINHAESSSSEKSAANQMKLELIEMTENELLLETLVKAQGYEDCAVIIGRDSDNVNVLVKSAEISLNDAIKIYSIVSSELGIGAENVNITPIS